MALQRTVRKRPAAELYVSLPPSHDLHHRLNGDLSQATRISTENR